MPFGIPVESLGSRLPPTGERWGSIREGPAAMAVVALCREEEKLQVVIRGGLFTGRAHVKSVRNRVRHPVDIAG